MDAQTLAELEIRKEELIKIHNDYLSLHPEITEVLNDYISNVLLHKPQEIYTFTRKYFAKFNPQPLKTRPIVMCGPKGVGKSTLLNMLLDEKKNFFQIVPCLSTLENKKDIKDHNVVSKQEFEQCIEEGRFLEYQLVNSVYTGTLKSDVERVQSSQKVPILHVDLNSAEQIFRANIDAHFMFIMPPDMKSLKDRICAQKNAVTEQNQLRQILRNAAAEVEQAKMMKIFEFKLINAELQQAFADFTKILSQLYEHAFY